jgi:phosphoribosylformimino-5-aminoimidazole carboxamide ribotide isomerase
MIFYPSIDLLDGQVVRLIEGDFGKKTVFSSDPESHLESFQKAGARFLHLVDLTGARDPLKKQTQKIEKLIAKTVAKVQVGGGIRRFSDIENLLRAGADRVVIGSLAVSNPEIVFRALDKFGSDRLTLALDVRISDQTKTPMAMTQAWTRFSGLSFAQVFSRFEKRGLRRVLCTDIAVDGRPSGPSLTMYQALMQQFPEMELQASGGVRHINDLVSLDEIKVHSVVVGRALLTGALDIQQAISYAV